ncbi:unnamed protein product [Parascedosporium putredinis]|uniref:Uncharacterized protein n=1 Tax=Parascedosporium putredinis TaxID=1442378 RepID=A0A9P1MB52_9PEZI|nr:unnamed protein product [Parascedosporium putredinis]CAI7993962.1 unnamed protein product [Parascedosporium putredinis]
MPEGTKGKAASRYTPNQIPRLPHPTLQHVSSSSHRHHPRPLALAEFSDVFSILEDGACRSCLLDIYNPCAAADKYSESLTGAFSECVCGSAGEAAAKSCREKSCTDTIGGLSVDTFYNTWCLNSNQGFREDKCALTDREFEFYVTNAGPALTTACDALRRADEDEAATGQEVRRLRRVVRGVRIRRRQVGTRLVGIPRPEG